MKLTRSVGYAVSVLLQISDHDSSEHVTATRIAKGCDLPPRFLYRVLRCLVDAGILSGATGPGGGYRLTRNIRKIHLLSIADAVEGIPEAARLQPVRPKHRRAIRQINQVCHSNEQRFRAELRKVSLAKLQKATKR